MLSWNYLAAKQGYILAQLRLALSNENYEGVEKNVDEAAIWYHKAAVSFGSVLQEW